METDRRTDGKGNRLSLLQNTLKMEFVITSFPFTPRWFRKIITILK